MLVLSRLVLDAQDEWVVRLLRASDVALQVALRQREHVRGEAEPVCSHPERFLHVLYVDDAQNIRRTKRFVGPKIPVLDEDTEVPVEVDLTALVGPDDS